MDVSTPIETYCLDAGHTEVVARNGRSYAEVDIALAADGRYCYGVSMLYSYGGFGGPIGADRDGFTNLAAARTAGMEELLRRWPKPFLSDPHSVHEELRFMREQIERQLQQPCLF